MGIHTYNPPTKGGATTPDPPAPSAPVYNPVRNPRTRISGENITLSYTAPLGPIPTGTYIRYYEWEAGQTSPFGFNVGRRGTSTRTSFIIRGLESNTTYQIRIRVTYFTTANQELAGRSEYVHTSDFTTEPEDQGD